MKLRFAIALSFLWVACLASSLIAQQPAAPAAAPVYFPPRGSWEHRKPSQVGMDDAKIAAAIAWAQTQETDWPKDFSKQEEIFGKPLGPVPTTRADTNGVIVRNGFIIAEFGDTAAVDPTYSVAKSYLSTILGLTIDRGMIGKVTDPVKLLIHDGGYDSPHNAAITWQHHATQTSEWEGTLFDKPHTFLGVEEFGQGAMKPREIREPGTHYEYNDVRINRFSLSLLKLWKRPLPDVLKTEIMDPIGASDTWVYHGYRNSTVDVNGKQLVSVSGGTRWGGGLWISTLDHARFGYLILRKGQWAARQIISESWIREATSQQGLSKDYGYLWWLNTEGRWPAAPRTSFSAQGAGSNTIWIDPEHDLVVVWRWHKGNAQPEFYRRILEALVPAATPAEPSAPK
jgi:CubicO group peptidase (beta-lactamase class C family)